MSGFLVITPLPLQYAGPRDVCKLTFGIEDACKPVKPIGCGKRLGTGSLLVQAFIVWATPAPAAAAQAKFSS